MVASGGGIFSGRGGDAKAIVRPTIEAALADDAAVDIAGSGDVTVEATSLRAEANASAKSFGGGGIDIGVIFAEANASPTVTSTVAAGVTVTTAGGDVTVAAKALSQPTGDPKTDLFDADDVDPVADTIRFETHELNTGDRVTYDPNGNDPISIPGGSLGTLAGGREYNAIVIDADTIALGTTFNATSADAGSPLSPGVGVDPSRDVIRFGAPHRFRTGDPVRYSHPSPNAGIGLGTTATYYVRVLDDNTIKLFASRAEALASPSGFATSSVAGNTITLAGFEDGDAVTYLAPAASEFRSTLVDVTVDLAARPASVTAGDNDTIFLGRDTDNNGTIDAGHGFLPGQKVIYRKGAGTGLGLVDGQAYYVIPVDTYSIQLADSLLHAVGRADNPDTKDVNEAVPITKLPLSPDKADGAAEVRHFLIPVSLGVLESGVTYYVINPDGDGQIQLAASRGGPALNLDTTERSGTHQLGAAGVELAGSTGVHALRIDLASDPVGNHKLLGSGGVSLRQIAPPGRRRPILRVHPGRVGRHRRHLGADLDRDRQPGRRGHRRRQSDRRGRRRDDQVAGGRQHERLHDQFRHRRRRGGRDRRDLERGRQEQGGGGGRRRHDPRAACSPWPRTATSSPAPRATPTVSVSAPARTSRPTPTSPT